MPNTQNKPKIISVFNNKGGVGKTTYLYHLAHLLAESGKKVLCMDCDSQCNLTAYCMGPENIFKDYFDNDRKNTIYKAISPFINDMDKFKEIDFYGIKKYSNGGRLDLVQGDLSLSDFEDNLGRSYLSTTHASDVFQQIAIYNFLLKMGSHNKYGFAYDFILIDLGPNLGALNRSVLNSSDYIITPMSPDMFSIQATQNLGRKMKEWSEEWSDFLKELQKPKRAILNHSLRKLEGVNLQLPKGKPQFLGYILQRFATSGGGKKMATAFEKFAKTVDLKIEENIVNVIPDQIQNINRRSIKKRFCLGEIEDLRTGIPWSMRLSKPFYDIEVGDTDNQKDEEGKIEKVTYATAVLCQNPEIRRQCEISSNYILSL